RKGTSDPYAHRRLIAGHRGGRSDQADRSAGSRGAFPKGSVRMKSPLVDKNYALLTPADRCRLIIAASGRDDEAERTRLIRTGGHITLSMRDHAPWAHAFNELALLLFIELLEDAAAYLDSFHCTDSEEQEVSPEDEAKLDETVQDLDVSLALGYILRAK